MENKWKKMEMLKILLKGVVLIHKIETVLFVETESIGKYFNVTLVCFLKVVAFFIYDAKESVPTLLLLSFVGNKIWSNQTTRLTMICRNKHRFKDHHY